MYYDGCLSSTDIWLSVACYIFFDHFYRLLRVSDKTKQEYYIGLVGSRVHVKTTHKHSNSIGIFSIRCILLE